MRNPAVIRLSSTDGVTACRRLTITTLAIPCSTWDGRMLHSRNATTASPRTLSLKSRVSSHDRPNASNELPSSSSTTTGVVTP